MSLLSRVVRLESRVQTPAKPVYVVFQKAGESDEKVVSRIKAENRATEAMLYHGYIRAGEQQNFLFQSNQKIPHWI